MKRLDDVRGDMDHPFGDMDARLAEIRDDVRELRREGSAAATSDETPNGTFTRGEKRPGT